MSGPASITAPDIGRHVDALAGLGPRDPTSTEAIVRTLRYLTEQLTGWGYDVSVERYGSDLHEVNVLAGPPGADLADGVLEVGAHWDSVAGSPGADDNASGVAGVLEVAHALSTCDGVRFCFYGGEEDGLVGSAAHLDRVATTSEAVHGAIVLEMIGYRRTGPHTQRVPASLSGLVEAPTSGDFIAVVADPASGGYAAAFEQAALAQAPGLAVFVVTAPGAVAADLYRSDHVPYWLSGRPALQITDTAEYRNPHYHRPSDTPDTLDLDFAAQVARAVAGATLALAR